jgi:protein-disulfide isomerase
MVEDKTNPGITKKAASAERKRAARRGFPWAVVLMPLVFMMGLGVGYLVWGMNIGEAVAAEPQAQPAVQIPEQVQRFDVPVDDDYIYGPEDAPITIVEFSDYECPYCKRWYDQVWLRLREEYPDEIRLVYRDLPLPGHPNAIPSAEAANCAGEQDKYWQFHDLLFSDKYGLNAQAYLDYAGELGLDMEAFRQCVEERRYKEEVEADLAWASQLGVSSTPTFFINGIPLVGAQPFEVFQQVIDLELSGEIP